MFQQPASKPVISPRTISEINQVWAQYEVLKAAQTEDRRKKAIAQNAAGVELAALLDTFLASPAGKDWYSRHGISADTISVAVNGTVSISFKVA